MKYISTKAFLKKPTKKSTTRCEQLGRQRKEEPSIPGDVPRGHLVVYVGEERKRFVIRVCILQHPLFQELLDRAQQEYGFIPNSRLRIPCDVRIFGAIVHHINAQHRALGCSCS